MSYVLEVLLYFRLFAYIFTTNNSLKVYYINISRTCLRFFLFICQLVINYEGIGY